MTDWTPPTQDLPHAPPPPESTEGNTMTDHRNALALIDERARQHEDVVTDLTHAQQIRSDAIYTAACIVGDVSGTAHGVAAHLIELAEPIAAYIRTGQRPS